MLPLYLWKIDVIKFPLFPSKIGCILNSLLLYHTTTEISEKQNCRNVNSVHHMCAPNIIKIGWFLTKIFQKWTFLLGHCSVFLPKQMFLSNTLQLIDDCHSALWLLIIVHHTNTLTRLLTYDVSLNELNTKIHASVFPWCLSRRQKRVSEFRRWSYLPGLDQTTTTTCAEHWPDVTDTDTDRQTHRRP